MNGMAMASSCCVCSDGRGWAENPLVYCDGEGCNIGVHKACYGIITVPEGPWYCRKCESHERSARVRCELCPSKEGALKRSDSGGWAHVICGLYIPEVRFGSVQTMEPIVLSQVPTDRFQKICYICEQNNRGHKASMGACMDCNKVGCKQQFHVTCAQSLGLLCEEPGNYQDNVKYCGYCHEHHSRLVLKKSSNVKVIPAFKPKLSINTDELMDKKSSNNQTADMKLTIRKTSLTKTTIIGNQKPEFDLANGLQNMNQQSPVPSASEERTHSNSAAPFGIPPVSDQYSSKNEKDSRFTSSNFVESILTPSNTVFMDQQNIKKRKISEMNTNAASNLSSNSINERQPPSPKRSSFVSLDSEENIKPKSNNHIGINDADDDDDDESAVLNFVEEPNLSAIKSDSVNSSISVVPSRSSSVTPVISKAARNNSSCTPSPAESIPVSSVSAPAATIQRSTASNSGSSQPYTFSLNSPPVPSSSPGNLRETKVRNVQSNTNTSSAPHMLGNQLNPSSTMAQKMFDSLNDELQAHSVFTSSDSQTKSNAFVGPPLYNKIISSTKESKKSNKPSLNGGPLASLSGSGNFPQSLEELLEKQWEQGGTFLMEQAQHFDIASLLTCLHKLRAENLELEDHVRNLKARRDHLLGVNARLAMPLAPISQPVNVTQPSQSGGQHVATASHKMQNMPQQGTQSNQQQPKQHLMSSNANASQQQQQMHHGVLSQAYQPQANPTVVNSSDGGQLRNIPMPGGVYPTLRGNNAYQNAHSIENDLMSAHHQNARVLPKFSSSNHIRHHSSPSNPMYMTSPRQSPNPGVVIRSLNQHRYA